MKKLLGLLCALCCAPWALADTLSFVTVLSSPVGTFNKLETVNPNNPVTAPKINFCTGIGDGGTVTLQAKNASVHPTMNTVALSQNTELGGNGANYVLDKITMNSGGTLKGSRLLAKTVAVNRAAAGKSENLYTDTLTVAGAKTAKLYVNEKDSYIETSHTDPGMVWSNQYQADNACKDGNGCAKQYLLKEQRGTSSSCETNFQVNNECCEWVWNNRSTKKGTAEFNSCWKVSSDGGWQYTVHLACQYLGPGTHGGVDQTGKTKKTCSVKGSPICLDINSGAGETCSPNVSNHTDHCVFSVDGSPAIKSYRGKDNQTGYQDAYYFESASEAQNYFVGANTTGEPFQSCIDTGAGCYAVYQYRECTSVGECPGRTDNSVCYVRK